MQTLCTDGLELTTTDLLIFLGFSNGFTFMIWNHHPNERKGSQQIKSDVCANRFYEHIEEQKTAVSEYLDKTFGVLST